MPGADTADTCRILDCPPRAAHRRSPNVGFSPSEALIAMAMLTRGGLALVLPGNTEPQRVSHRARDQVTEGPTLHTGHQPAPWVVQGATPSTGWALSWPRDGRAGAVHAAQVTGPPPRPKDRYRDRCATACGRPVPGIGQARGPARRGARRETHHHSQHAEHARWPSGSETMRCGCRSPCAASLVLDRSRPARRGVSLRGHVLGADDPVPVRADSLEQWVAGAHPPGRGRGAVPGADQGVDHVVAGQVPAGRGGDDDLVVGGCAGAGPGPPWVVGSGCGHTEGGQGGGQAGR
jgi:hypothetical protein